MKSSEFNYRLPPGLIAHRPAEERDHSRLMLLDSTTERIEHRYFYDIANYLLPGDLLVLNNSRVIRARLFGVKEGGSARIEVLLSRQINDRTWECLVKPGKRLKVGARVVFDKDFSASVLDKKETGEQIIEFECEGGLIQAVEKKGEIPLPPYVKNLKSEILNPKQGSKFESQIFERYQTIYADVPGASAAPTAGLHFTSKLLTKLKDKGVNIAYLTLHAGLGTFQPVRTEEVEEHQMHSEYYDVPEETIEAINGAKRVVAVGTTTVRALESIRSAARGQRQEGKTSLFIYPGYKFKVVDALVTNFHWPESSLIMLVSAFAGKEFVMKAYQEAIKHRYRFYSFGDAMLVL